MVRNCDLRTTTTIYNPSEKWQFIIELWLIGDRKRNLSNTCGHVTRVHRGYGVWLALLMIVLQDVDPHSRCQNTIFFLLASWRRRRFLFGLFLDAPRRAMHLLNLHLIAYCQRLSSLYAPHFSFVFFALSLSKLLCSVNRIKITFDRIYASGAVCHCCCVIFVQTTQLQLFLMSIWRPNTMCCERAMPNSSFHCLSEPFVPKFRSLAKWRECNEAHIWIDEYAENMEKRELEINPHRCT